MPDLKTLLQLTRFPNVFTAVSNIFAAYLLTHQDLGDWPAFALLVGSSSLLYLAGMVLNDVFDVAQDTSERPQRPIPSGRISLTAAKRIGATLLVGGIALGWLVSVLRHTLTPGIVATMLGAAVVLYDGPLKRTPLAPLGMGFCRFLNILLGLSLASIGPFQWHPMHWLVAAGVGIYIVGVTLFARTEAQHASRRLALLCGMILMLCGIGLLGYFPRWATADLPEAAQPLPQILGTWLWPIMWGLFGFFTVRRCVPAIVDPSPLLVQFAVKQAIFAIVIFDAAIITATHHPVPFAIVIVAFLLPMHLLGQVIYST
ncbi:MAG: UbiA family prenyltransferase [Planctomycetia bacterium]|nr:UbiA family prenyltransferase [Planctomycetia bacterium]